MDELFELMMIQQQKQELVKVLESNEYTKKFGVVLLEEDAKELMLCRKENLRQMERVEFKEGILPKIIYTFCDSPYIYQDNYVESIARLQEIFYLYKNESLDELNDDELIQFMKEAFEGECQGSLEYLEETSLEGFARGIRGRTHGFFGKYNEEENYDE